RTETDRQTDRQTQKERNRQVRRDRLNVLLRLFSFDMTGGAVILKPFLKITNSSLQCNSCLHLLPSITGLSPPLSSCCLSLSFSLSLALSLSPLPSLSPLSPSLSLLFLHSFLSLFHSLHYIPFSLLHSSLSPLLLSLSPA